MSSFHAQNENLRDQIAILPQSGITSQIKKVIYCVSLVHFYIVKNDNCV